MTKPTPKKYNSAVINLLPPARTPDRIGVATTAHRLSQKRNRKHPDKSFLFGIGPIYPFTELRKMGIENFKKVYFTCHGTPEHIRIFGARVSAKVFAKEFAESSGLDNFVNSQILAFEDGSDLEPIELNLTFASCKLGQAALGQATHPRDWPFEYLSSRSFAEDFLICLSMRYEQKVREARGQMPGSSLTLRFKVTAPRSFAMILYDGSMVCAEESRVATTTERGVSLEADLALLGEKSPYWDKKHFYEHFDSKGFSLTAVPEKDKKARFFVTITKHADGRFESDLGCRSVTFR